MSLIKTRLEPSQWQYEATYEGVLQQVRMLIFAMEKRMVSWDLAQVNLTDEAVTPFGVTCEDFDEQLLHFFPKAGQSPEELADARDFMARTCGYTDYVHMMSLTEVATEFWLAKYQDRVEWKDGSDTVVIRASHVDFLKRFAQMLMARLKIDLNWLNSIPASILPANTLVETSCLALKFRGFAWGQADLGSKFIRVECDKDGNGLGGQGPEFSFELESHWLTEPTGLAVFLEEVEVKGKEQAEASGMEYTLDYNLREAERELGFFRSSSSCLFYPSVTQYVEETVVEVYEHSEPGYVVVLEYDKQGTRVDGFKVENSHWLECEKGLTKDFPTPTADEASFDHIRALVDHAEEQWGCSDHS